MGSISADFSGETVIVTGGSSGIGRAVARAFGNAGAVVLIADVREEPKDLDAGTPTAEVVRGAGGEAAFVETDVSDPGEVAAIVEAAREYGGVDVMINNAGVHVSREFLDVTPEEFEHVHGVNARGVFFGTQAAARDMLDRGEPGVVVNTASTSSFSAGWEHSHYSASKGAVKMITRSAALELAHHGIRVNAVAPGATATEITEGFSERAQEVGGGRDPPVRAARPADLAPAYLYLASEDAGHVTGEITMVTGGSHVA